MERLPRYYTRNHKLYHTDCGYRIPLKSVCYDWAFCDYCTSQRKDNILIGVSGIECEDLKPLYEYENKLTERRDHLKWALTEFSGDIIDVIAILNEIERIDKFLNCEQFEKDE